MSEEVKKTKLAFTVDLEDARSIALVVLAMAGVLVGALVVGLVGGLIVRGFLLGSGFGG